MEGLRKLIGKRLSQPHLHGPLRRWRSPTAWISRLDKTRHSYPELIPERRSPRMGRVRRQPRGTRRPPVALIGLLLLSVIMCSTWWLSSRHDSPRLSPYEALAQAEFERDAQRLPVATGLIVNSSACRLPDYDPWDASVAGLIREDHRFPGCRQNFPVRLAQDGRLLRMYTSADTSCKLRCCHRSVMRRDEGRSDDNYQFGNTSTCFEEGKAVEVNDEFIQVKCFCKGNDTAIYEDFRAFIVPKPAGPFASEASKNKAEKLNVYMVGLDSVSRLQFKRFMPEIETLLANDFDAVSMDGLTKVGVNTFPNMLAFLAGMELNEVKFLRDRSFDELPLIWKYFHRLGYVTMFNEDTPVEATFNYLKLGFFLTPTDFYMRPFYRAIEESRLVRSQQTLCINQREQLDLQLQWLQDFMTSETMSSSPQFALLFSSTLSHKGPLPFVEAMQARLEEFLIWYRNSPRYNSSIMFLFSDHGMRFGPVMRRELGGYESRLPFFYVIPPPWYARKFPERMEALRTNSRRLTTFFDAHATLRQLLLDGGFPESELPPFRHPGRSLFRSVPEERSCHDAGIAAHWCACHLRQPVPLDDEVVRRAAEAAVRHINKVLLGDLQSQCAELTLSRVAAAFHVRSQRGGKVQDMSIVLPAFEEYVVKFVTTPGAGEFEATVRARWREDGPKDHPEKAHEGDHWPKTAEERASAHEERKEAVASGPGGKPGEEAIAVVEVSRLNMFRGQSDCLLTQWDERRFCYCKNLL
ncbi:uncharacterized protein LOC122367925 isoform X2 [Amphibalanus amphitrite]|uniref:uncharacterized protein LOC122367925 isoform X2 n=1 Tax=Amphibalanus amphitrite TaxID=1232801 RepID=UPI001C913B66|nr:uncharacterized protein LOC122367925 isoform X2 [Amphibalanus amphitrite]